MSDYICEFKDGSYSPIVIGATWGKGEYAGTATRGDGFKRVVFFQDHPPTNGVLMIPRDGDPWVHNIRRRSRLAPKLELLVKGTVLEKMVAAEPDDVDIAAGRPI